MNALTVLFWTLLGCGLFGMVGCLIERIARHNDILPPPDKNARRDHYQEFQS
jgi:hypothetical protein